MKKYIYQVTATVKANCTEYKYVVDVDADNQKEAVQTAKGMWDKVRHLFHVKARRLEAHEEALYAFWKRYDGEPQTKSTPEEAHVDIDKMNRASASEAAPAETDTADDNKTETVSETATETDATEQATAKTYAVSFVVDGIAQANMAVAESAEAVGAYYNCEYSGRVKVCAVREAAEWEIAENRRRGMPFVTVPSEPVNEPETADEAANATDTAEATNDKEEPKMTTLLDVHTMNLSATEDEEIFSVKILWNGGDSWIEYADTAEAMNEWGADKAVSAWEIDNGTLNVWLAQPAQEAPDAGEPDAPEVVRILGGTLNLIEDNGDEVEAMKARVALWEQVDEFKRRGVALNVEYDADGRFVGVRERKAGGQRGGATRPAGSGNRE